MTLEQFMNGIRQNIARVKAYQLGMDGRNGQCDCIGLIIGGIRLAGGTWNGTHGSNYAARNEMRSMKKISSPSQLQPGDLVYKAYTPGQAGYSLPDTYKGHPDQNDYYHVGVVTSLAPLAISHCTGVPGGIKVDTALGAWQYAGIYKGIDAENQCLQPLRVTGGRLKLRKGPGTNYAVLAYIPDGATVMASETQEHPQWLSVAYNGEMGYAMARYLVKESEQTPDVKMTLEKLHALLQEAQQTVMQLISEQEKKEETQ